MEATHQQDVKTHSKSSDWTDVPLEVPETIPQKDKQYKEDGAPIPPPRKKKSLKETLGSLIPYKKPVVEEQLIVQKKINTRCPCCEDGFHRAKRVVEKEMEINSLKEVKKRKTPSIASLPNYTDFKLSVACETDIDKHDLEKHSSAHSLPDESKKPNVKTNEKMDYLTRARSFGSLLPTVLLQKMSTTKAPLAEIESDDSLGGMDDWGLNMIEHYKPRDSSLPRPRPRQRTQEEMLAEIEKQLDIEPIQEEEQKITPKTHQQTKCTPITDEIIDVKSATIVGADEPVEHSNLMKILKEYGENRMTDEVQKSQPINDFLNAERAHFPEPIAT